MRLTSPAFEHRDRIPPRYTCEGENVNPPLVFDEVPEGAESLVLIMDDPDMPRNIRPDGVWDHWIIYNLPPELGGVGEGQQPPGDPGTGTAQNLGYFGPCPPDGEHRYFLTLYALDTRLELQAYPGKHQVLEAMEGHVIDRAVLIGRYFRQF